ncbi:DUF2141 domain-containing protein [Sphingomonas bacterium]|uniref:DUF2141 domain-containing protein n=1 Tax=Sphingomonas bacterium TaxID=1895847 RepID=UPI0020C619C3|nr:DUF2141 domain-containing protein [Sphingomonas bacterium]
MKAAALLAAAMLLPAAGPVGTTVTVQVGNIRNANGNVHVDICPQAQFLTENCPYRATVRAVAGVTTLVLQGVPAGRYAAQATHDENRNGKVDRALFGIPKEGVGFSNDAKIRFGPPKFDDAAFAVGATPNTIRFSLRYFLGASGPAKR